MTVLDLASEIISLPQTPDSPYQLEAAQTRTPYPPGLPFYPQHKVKTNPPWPMQQLMPYSRILSVLAPVVAAGRGAAQAEDSVRRDAGLRGPEAHTDKGVRVRRARV